MTDERLDTQISNSDESDPPSLLKELKDAVDELFPVAKSSAKKFLRGKGEAEIAKAAEIKAKALALIGQLEIDSKRLVAEREDAERKSKLDEKKAEMEHEERMFDLKTQRFKELVAAATKLKELGMPIEAVFEMMQKQLQPAEKKGSIPKIIDAEEVENPINLPTDE